MSARSSAFDAFKDDGPALLALSEEEEEVPAPLLPAPQPSKPLETEQEVVDRAIPIANEDLALGLEVLAKHLRRIGTGLKEMFSLVTVVVSVAATATTVKILEFLSQRIQGRIASIPPPPHQQDVDQLDYKFVKDNHVLKMGSLYRNTVITFARPMELNTELFKQTLKALDPIIPMKGNLQHFALWLSDPTDFAVDLFRALLEVGVDPNEHFEYAPDQWELVPGSSLLACFIRKFFNFPEAPSDKYIRLIKDLFEKYNVKPHIDVFTAMAHETLKDLTALDALLPGFLGQLTPENETYLHAFARSRANPTGVEDVLAWYTVKWPRHWHTDNKARQRPYDLVNSTTLLPMLSFMAGLATPPGADFSGQDLLFDSTELCPALQMLFASITIYNRGWEQLELVLALPGCQALKQTNAATLESLLSQAVLNGKLVVVRILLRSFSVSPLVVTDEGKKNTCLHTAIELEALEIAKELLTAGAKLNEPRNGSKKTPILQTTNKQLSAALIDFAKTLPVTPQVVAAPIPPKPEPSARKSKKKKPLASIPDSTDKPPIPRTETYQLDDEYDIFGELSVAEGHGRSLPAPKASFASPAPSPLLSSLESQNTAVIEKAREEEVISKALEELELGLLPWEVVYSLDALKSIPQLEIAVAKAVVLTIHQIATGEWTKKSCKQLQGPKALVVYEAKNLPKGYRLIWSVDIEFSPLKKCHTDVIKIWDLVAHDNVNRVVEHLNQKKISTRSAARQELLARLDMTDNPHANASISKLKLPRTYHLKVENGGDAAGETKSVTPPNSYPYLDSHVVDKFYEMSKEVLRSLQEYEILNIKASVLLVGRSGTGKTTCAILRMWGLHRASLKLAQEGILLGSRKPSKKDSQPSQFNQMFVTVSPVLCEMVRSYWQGLQAAHAEEPMKYTTVTTLAGILEAKLPLVLTFAQFLEALDGTLTNSFFATAESLSAAQQRNLTKVWQARIEEEMAAPLPSEKSAAQATATSPLNDGPHASPARRFQRKYIDFEVFHTICWPKMISSDEWKSYRKSYDSNLIWTEIVSFIKGTLPALKSLKGYLTEEQYLELGNKKAPMFREARPTIYRLFLRYLKIKHEIGGYDILDVIKHAYDEISAHGYSGTEFHNINIDEVQDLPEAALQLFFLICRNKDGFFFCGDTAQTIQRGTSFRFKDLSSLFYENGLQKGNIPPVRKLTNSYRSTAEILSLGQSVIDMIETFFPDSIDRLTADNGVYTGPPPVVIPSESNEELLLSFLGSEGHGTAIEFGAHQVIIVRNEQSKEKLPVELKENLVMTVSEVKGLEFEDVLLYNFFADSRVDEGWRVINDYASKKPSLAKTAAQASPVVEMNFEALDAKTTGRMLMALEFSNEKHKLLNSELKQLYMVITRARSNLWVFDDHREQRLPIEKLWTKDGLVTSKFRSPNAAGRVKKSTRKEWRERAMTFVRRRQYRLAAFCFKQSKDSTLHTYMEANHLADSEKFDEAAQLFSKVATESAREAWPSEKIRELRLNLAKCLYAARKYQEATGVFEGLENWKGAARCHARLRNWKAAGELYLKDKEYELALDAASRSGSFSLLTDLFTQAGPSLNPSDRNAEKFILRALTYLHEAKRGEQVMKAVQWLATPEKRSDWLKNHGYIVEAAQIVSSKSKGEAGALLEQSQHYTEAAELYLSLKNYEGAVRCYASGARRMLKATYASGEEIDNARRTASLLFKKALSAAASLPSESVALVELTVKCAKLTWTHELIADSLALLALTDESQQLKLLLGVYVPSKEHFPRLDKGSNSSLASQLRLVTLLSRWATALDSQIRQPDVASAIFARIQSFLGAAPHVNPSFLSLPLATCDQRFLHSLPSNIISADPFQPGDFLIGPADFHQRALAHLCHLAFEAASALLRRSSWRIQALPHCYRFYIGLKCAKEGKKDHVLKNHADVDLVAAEFMELHALRVRVITVVDSLSKRSGIHLGANLTAQRRRVVEGFVEAVLPSSILGSSVAVHAEWQGQKLRDSIGGSSSVSVLLTSFKRIVRQEGPDPLMNNTRHPSLVARLWLISHNLRVSTSEFCSACTQPISALIQQKQLSKQMAGSGGLVLIQNHLVPISFYLDSASKAYNSGNLALFCQCLYQYLEASLAQQLLPSHQHCIQMCEVMVVPALVMYRYLAFRSDRVELTLPESLLAQSVQGPSNEPLFKIDPTEPLTAAQQACVEALPQMLSLLFDTVYRRKVDHRAYSSPSQHEIYTDYTGTYYIACPPEILIRVALLALAVRANVTPPSHPSAKAVFDSVSPTVDTILACLKQEVEFGGPEVLAHVLDENSLSPASQFSKFLAKYKTSFVKAVIETVPPKSSSKPSLTLPSKSTPPIPAHGIVTPSAPKPTQSLSDLLAKLDSLTQTFVQTCPIQLNTSPTKPSVEPGTDYEAKPKKTRQRQPGQHDCDDYVFRGWCRFGKACRFFHPPKSIEDEEKKHGENTITLAEHLHLSSASPSAAPVISTVNPVFIHSQKHKTKAEASPSPSVESVAAPALTFDPSAAPFRKSQQLHIATKQVEFAPLEVVTIGAESQRQLESAVILAQFLFRRSRRRRAQNATSQPGIGGLETVLVKVSAFNCLPEDSKARAKGTPPSLCLKCRQPNAPGHEQAQTHAMNSQLAQATQGVWSRLVAVRHKLRLRHSAIVTTNSFEILRTHSEETNKELRENAQELDFELQTLTDDAIAATLDSELVTLHTKKHQPLIWSKTKSQLERLSRDAEALEASFLAPNPSNAIPE